MFDDRSRSATPFHTAGKRVLVVDDESTIRGPVGLCLETLGHQVAVASSADEAIQSVHSEPFDIGILDVRLGVANGLDLMAKLLSAQPRLKLIIITAYASVDVAVRAMSRGATEFLCKPFTPDQLSAAVSHAAELAELEATVAFFPERSGAAGAEADFATTSLILQDAIRTARNLAPSRDPIVIEGERGTGKKVLARTIHAWSAFPEGPIVGIDCASRSASYVDLALFGYSVMGDQVVNSDRPSLIAQGDGGTLVIARAESLTPSTQSKLAGFIRTGSFENHNSAKIFARNVRLIFCLTFGASLGEPLASLANLGRITLPPLRDRPEDIPTIAQRYLSCVRQAGNKSVQGFSVEALDALKSYPWPDNLSELRKLVTDAVNAADSVYVEKRHLPPAFRDLPAMGESLPRAGDSVSLQQLEAAHIAAVVAKSPSLQAAAQSLGLDFQALYRRRKQYGLE